jgi:hypothetical protein
MEMKWKTKILYAQLAEGQKDCLLYLQRWPMRRRGDHGLLSNHHPPYAEDY